MALDAAFVHDINDWLQWYNYHRRAFANAPLERRVEFLSKANYGALKLIAGLADEVCRVDEGKRAAGGGPQIILPVGVQW